MEILDQPNNTSDLPTATDGNRILAYIIDVLVSIPLYLIPYLGLFLGVAYFIVRDGLPFLDGQSIGKKAMGIRAVTMDGQSLSGNWGPAIIRNAVLLIPFFPLVELIVMLNNANKQRLGDQWAGTRVVSVK
ncbi:MAG: RDD family protein [Saprospiraceae bacterium]|nr:RDD family protein [Saprospiraceae bacterium]